jgi:multimeric flavodoxin WrbA
VNVLGINGSPRGKESHTDHILQPFLEGAREASASAETIYLKDHEIRPCTGCFTCWLVTPGKCVFKDDMTWILEKILEANVMVFATPLYNGSMSALMKAWHERQIPLGEPYVIINEQGEMAHPLRHPDKSYQKWVLISNAGMPETKHFGGLLDNYKRMAIYHGGGGYVELVGSILKGMGGAFSKAPADPGSLEWFYEACRRAGREVVKEGRISAETSETLERPLFDMTPETYVETLNSFLAEVLQMTQQG